MCVYKSDCFDVYVYHLSIDISPQWYSRRYLSSETSWTAPRASPPNHARSVIRASRSLSKCPSAFFQCLFSSQVGVCSSIIKYVQWKMNKLFIYINAFFWTMFSLHMQHTMCNYLCGCSFNISIVCSVFYSVKNSVLYFNSCLWNSISLLSYISLISFASSVDQ